MGHDHHSHHGQAHHHHLPATLGRAFALGVGLNLCYVIVEFLFGWHLGSLALMADAGHNLSDVASLLLAWSAASLASRPATNRRTFGWRKLTILSALGSGILLVAAMLTIAWESVRALFNPGDTPGMPLIIVAAVGVVINGVTAALFMRGGKHDLNLRGAFLHMAADALVSLGVVLAGVVLLFHSWSWLDPLVSLLIVLIVIHSSWSLLKEAGLRAIDAVPDHIDPELVAAWLLALDGVSQLHDLHIWSLSTTEVALSAHLLMPGGHPGDGWLYHVQHELAHEFGIHHATLQIEIGDSAAEHACLSCESH